jgi:hypothetical protein
VTAIQIQTAMAIPANTRRALSSAVFGVGSVWAVAGVFKLLFGTQLTLPILPPLGLERVAPWPSIGVAIGLFALGGWLGRSARRAASEAGVIGEPEFSGRERANR